MGIRLAKFSDIEAMRVIYNQAVLVGQKTADIAPVSFEDRVAWYKAHSLEKYPIFVEEDENRVRGYLSISAYRTGRMALRYTAEVSYYIHEDYHRRGIASRLLKYAIEICPSLEIKSLFAILLDSNEGSYKLLEKFDFEVWGHLPRIADFDGMEVGHLYYGLRIAEGSSECKVGV